MQLNSPKSRFHKETCLLQITSLVILLLIGLLSGCNAYQKNRDGLTFIASRGMLPVQSIVWSPTDENRILATAFSVGQWPAYIYLLDLKTGQKQAVAKTDSGWFHKATWTSDGKNVLILAGDNTREFEPPGWWKVDIASDSSEHLKDLGYTVVTWSPDGKMMVTESGGDVYLTNVITEAEEIIHTNIESIDDYSFSWSQDGQYLVFPAGQAPTMDLYVLNIKTRKVAQITEDGISSFPVWSPKGNIIVFEKRSPVGGKTTLYLISPDGKCEVGIPGLENIWSPTWSPDGKELAFIGIDGIYYLEVDKVLGRDIYQNLCR